MIDRDQHDSAQEQEPVVVRDRRRVDPATGEVRDPAVESPVDDPAGAAPAEETPGNASLGDASPGDGDPRVGELTAEVAERTADLQRLSAEYANYRRRVDRDRESVLVSTRVQFVSELLTVLDDLDRAESHGDLTGPFKAVADKIVSVVQKQGLEAFGSDGELFDPSVHEAVQHDTSDATGPTVAVVSSVLRRGYRIADRTLRPAMVTVTDQPDDGTAPAADPEAGDPPTGGPAPENTEQ